MVKTSVAGTRLVGRVTVGVQYNFASMHCKHSFLLESQSLPQSNAANAFPDRSKYGCSNGNLLTMMAVLAGNRNGLLLPNTVTDQGDSCCIDMVHLFACD